MIKPKPTTLLMYPSGQFVCFAEDNETQIDELQINAILAWAEYCREMGYDPVGCNVFVGPEVQQRTIIQHENETFSLD